MPVYPQPPPPRYQEPPWYTRRRITESDVERNPQTQVELALYNMMLPYMDPYTQWSMGNMLAQKAPELFGEYAGVAAEPGSQIPQPSRLGGNEQYLNRQRLQQALEMLTPENLANQVLGDQDYNLRNMESRTAAATIEGFQQEQAPMLWLKEYLSTAAAGSSYQSGGEGRAQLPTLTERNMALAHLETLENQANQDPTFQNVLTLGQSLVNPALNRPESYGGVGFERAVTNPFGDFSRKGVKRSPWLT